jgi:hypothetical protein
MDDELMLRCVEVIRRLRQKSSPESVSPCVSPTLVSRVIRHSGFGR